MKTVKKIEKSIDEIRFGIIDGDAEFIPITSSKDGKITQEELIDAICFLVSEIKSTIGEDLEDIWKRLDNIEEELGLLPK